MKKFLLSLGAIMLSLTMSAQLTAVKTFPGELKRDLAPSTSTAKMAGPRKALAENQQYMGAYTTDTYSSSGLGLTSYPGTYEMCAYLPQSILTTYDGGKVVGMRFAVSQAASTTKCFIYNYTDKGISVLAEGKVSSSKAGWNTVMFDEPFTLDFSTLGDLMMGYDYKQTSSNYPIAVANEGTICNTYLYGDLGEGAAFYDIGLSNYGNLCVQAIVEKEFDKISVGATDFEDAYAQLNENVNVNVTLTNMGSDPVNSVGYTVAVNGVASEEQTYTLPSAFTTFGGTFTLALPFGVQTEIGTKEYTVTITKVNGETNPCTTNVAKGKVITVKKLFAHNVVVEEFTGTGCGWCPRGLQGMENLRETFGDNFVGIGIHQYSGQTSDAMYIAKNNYAQLSFSGAPSCMIERGEEVDPYYGANDDIRNDFRAVMNKIAPVGVEVSGTWNDDKTAVNATATIEALVDGNAYDIEYVLIADGLSGTTTGWKQSNYYYQYSASQLPADLQKFGSGGEYGKSSFTGYVFNDVAIASSYVNKVNQAATLGTLAEYTPVESSYTIAMPTYAKLLSAIDYNKVYVIALVVDKATKKIVNAAKAQVAEAPSTDLAFVDAEGKVIKDGATIVMDKAEEDDWGSVQILLEGVSVKNNTTEEKVGRLTVTIDEFVDGSFQCCFGTLCKALRKAGSLVIDNVTVGAGETVPVTNTEWVVGETYGTMAVKFSLDTNDNEVYTNMSNITVNFVYADPAASINAVNVDPSAGRIYNVAGQEVRDANAHGIFIQNGKKFVK